MNTVCNHCINTVLEAPASSKRQINGNKRHTHEKECNKTIPICRQHDYAHKKSQGIYKKILKVISEFSKFTGYKNIQNQLYSI